MRSGQSHTPETRARIAEMLRGRKHTPEARARMSEAHLGMKHSPETRARMRKHELDVIEKILALRESGDSFSAIAHKINVTKGVIAGIIHRVRLNAL